MNNKRWKLNRAGLFNFWYYDYQEYNFKDGHLLLRGGNGSGKSVTMQSLITFLLDGNKLPSRLDPFGSNDRKMRDYLLGEKHINQIENRIGYLFLEYKLEDSEQYITTGYGLEAKKDTTALKDWGFVIFNRFTRIHKGVNGLKLYKTEMIDGKEQKIPLNESEFKKAVGNNGIVCDSKEEYVKSVNKHLFGFSDYKKLEQFTELLKELKSPKLSKGFKPTDLSQILLNSLPELEEDELTPLTDTITAIDQIENDISKTTTDIKSLKKITTIYDKYNELILLEKAYNYIETKKKVTNELKLKKANEKELDELNIQKSNIENQITKLVAEQEAKEEEKRSLGLGTIGDLKEEQNIISNKIKELMKNIEIKDSNSDTKQGMVQNVERKIDEREVDIDKSKRNLEGLLSELEGLSEEIKLDLHESLASQFKRNYEKGIYDGFPLWKEEAKKHQAFVQQIRELLGQHESLIKLKDDTELEIQNTELTIDDEEKIARDLEEKYEDARAVLFEEVEKWIQNVQELNVDEELKLQLGHSIQGLLEGISEDSLRAPIDELYQHTKSSVMENQIKRTIKIKDTNSQIKKIRQEMLELRDQKVMEPLWGEKEKALDSLRQKKIPYLPFYAAVEFKEGVKEEVKSALESAFNESGLLKALIVPDKYRSEVSKEIVVADKGSTKAQNLLTYLYATPESGVSESDINGVLSSVSIVEHEEGFILANGHFKQSFILGTNKQYGEAKYVGKIARKQLKEQKLHQLDEQLTMLTDEIIKHQAVADELTNQLVQIEAEYKQFPKISTLKQAKLAYENKQSEIENVYKSRLNTLDETLKETKIRIGKSMSDIKVKIDFTELELSFNVFEKAYTHTSEYLMALSEVETTYNNYKTSVNSISDLKNQREFLENEIQNNNEEMYDLKKELEIQKNRHESIEKQLEAQNAKDIEKRYEVIINRLKEIPKEIDVAKDSKRDIDGSINQLIHKINSSEYRLVFLENKTEAWKDIFSAEFNLKLVQVEIEDEQNSLEKIAKEIRNALKEAHQVNNQDDIDELKLNTTKRLEKAFNDQLAYLTEYNLTKTLETDEFTLEHRNESEEQEVRVMKNICQRQKIELEFDFTMRTPGYVLDKWEEHLVHQESVLTVKERKLFEETIIETVGAVIKNRIQHATYWIKEMNSFMENQSNSNGLGFKIKWSQKEEKDKTTKKNSVMDLLKKDINLLSENDREKISRFFKNKVTEAKRTTEKDSQVTLSKAIKEALDYRRWYQFDIMYKKGDTNLQFVPLTNSKFNKFSGGEKALSMYVPLFSSVHSRLLEAAPDAPRIISLDEAFAGVDDNNINEMFQLAESLDFDYIMNSQALWGCYDKVSSLSIYEIIRPQDAPFVGTAHYEWDGKNKNFIPQDFTLTDLEEKEIDLFDIDGEELFRA